MTNDNREDPTLIDQSTYENSATARRVKRVNDDGTTHQDPALTITNAIDSTAFDLNAAPFSETTNISNDYIFDSVLLNFSTAESKTITITGPDGTILLGGDEDQTSSNNLFNTTEKHFNIILQQAFNANDNITVAVTQFGSAGTMDCILKVQEGSSTLNGTPVLGAGDEIIGRVKITDGTNVANVNADTSSLDVGIKEPLTAFGEVTIAQMSPQIQAQFPYNINSAQWIIFPGNGGSVTNGDNHANVSTGTNTDGFGFILSRDVLKYNAGQGALARFSTKYTTGVANSEQIHGLGSKLDGYFFGFNGTDFGVLRRSSGTPEIRVLTITTGSSTAEDITITLDGIAVTNVTVSNSGDPTVTAREIAEHIYASVGTGWGALSAGNEVTFISVEPTSLSGTYSLSGATTAVGTFAQTTAGSAPTDSWIAQTAWNIDRMDGTGPSGMILDPTKGNIYQIRYQWLGYGAISYYMENDSTGRFQLVHRINYSNANTFPSSSNPTFGFFMSALSDGSTTDLTVSSSSMGAFIEGIELGLGPNFSAENLFAIGNVTAEEPVLTIRNKQVYQSQINRVRINPTSLTLTSNLNDTKGNTVFRTYLMATPENGTSYTDINTNSSVVEFDSLSLDFDTSEAILQSTFLLSATESQLFQLEDLRNKIGPGITFMITAQPSKGHATNEVGATINWRELF